MIDDIKEAINSFAKNVKDPLTKRDQAGLNKIHFELELLKDGHESKGSKKKVLTGAADLGLDKSDNI